VHAAIALAVLVSGVAVAGTAQAGGDSLRVDPAVATVPKDGTVTVHVVQDADVPTSGASVSIYFDPTLLQLKTVAKGAGYADAGLFNGASPAAITAANTTGKLVQVGASFLSAPDSVPAGEAVFLDVTFLAIGCGTARIDLPTGVGDGVTDALLLDGRDASYGQALQTSAADGSVTTCATATEPSPTGHPSPTVGPSASPSPSPTPTPAPTGNSMEITPSSATVAQDGQVSVRVVQRRSCRRAGPRRVSSSTRRS